MPGPSLDRFRRLADRLRRPEYTGENRCLPCTILNLCIAVALSALLGSIAPTAAAAFLTVSMLAIYYRGYLVPGTPTLTERFLPERVLALFDHTSPESASIGESVDIERVLLDAGVVTDDGADLQLTPSFRREWRASMREVQNEAEDRDALGAVVGADVDDLVFHEHGDAFDAWIDDQRVGQWESRAAFVADIAGGRLLADRMDSWASLSVAQRSAVLGGLRLFLEECPNCGGATTLGTSTVESCCRSMEVVAISCTECETRLFEEFIDDLPTLS